MKALVIIVAFLITALALWWLLSPDLQIANYPPKNDIIVAFGDSLVSGQGSTVGGDFVTKLSSRIGHPIVNLGVPGDTTEDGVARMDEVEEYDPGVVLLLLGGNDTLRRTALEITEANLRTLVTAFQKNGAVVVLIGVRGGLLGGSEREAIYERVAEENRAIYVEDILDGIVLKPELMHDGIHPNDAGYARIADRLASVFEESGLIQ